MSGAELERRGNAVSIEAPAAATLFGTNDPHEIIERSVQVADLLMKVVRDRGLVFRFNDRDWYGLQAYQALGAFFGVSTELEWSRPLADGSGWESRVVVRSMDGRILGAGEGMVTRDEKNWRNASEHSLRAMSGVRGQRRGLQSVLAFVVGLAGYDVADPSAPASRKQVTALHTIAGELGWSDEERHERAGVESFNDLTRETAGEMIDAWTDLAGASERPGASEPAAPVHRGTERVNVGDSSDPSRASASLDEAWSAALERFGSRVGVLKAALERWPSREGVSASSLTAAELADLVNDEGPA